MANDSDDPYVAWCVDETVFLLGRTIERELSERLSDCKSPTERQLRMNHVFQEFFGKEGQTGKSDVTKFKDPAELFKKGGV